jgi:threonine synthase
MVRIQGNYDDVNRLCSEIADKYKWAIVNVNLRPFYTEGAKTFGFEIAEQFGWKLPKHTILPTAGGTILPKVYKAYQEFIKLGLVEDNGPKIYSAQAAGCNPVVEAIKAGRGLIKPQKPRTIAKSIAIGNPADGYQVLQTIRSTGGSGAAVSDAQIVDAIRLLAETEGIFTEPAGGTTLAGAIELVQRGVIGPGESVVVCVTGNGYKTAEVVNGVLTQPVRLSRAFKEFEAWWESRQPAQPTPTATV